MSRFTHHGDNSGARRDSAEKKGADNKDAEKKSTIKGRIGKGGTGKNSGPKHASHGARRLTAGDLARQQLGGSELDGDASNATNSSSESETQTAPLRSYLGSAAAARGNRLQSKSSVVFSKPDSTEPASKTTPEQRTNTSSGPRRPLQRQPRVDIDSPYGLPRYSVWATITITTILFGYGAWQRRWIADDGLIVLRTVRNLLAGYGPVFNRGERVESNTSTAWTYIVWFFSWISQARIEYVVLTVALILSIAAIPIAMLGTSRLIRGHEGWGVFAHRRILILPAGALIYIALPPARDFATSGLEVCLCIFWTALLWWLTMKWSQGSDRSWFVLVVGFVAGLAPLVRPELTLLGALVLLLLVVTPIGWLNRIGVIVVAGILPVGYQIFRMGYYGLPVPNTAVAKDASGSKWGQGFIYLGNMLNPYWAWIPLIALLLFALLYGLVGRRLTPDRLGSARRARPRSQTRHPMWRQALRSPLATVVVFEIGGLLTGAYWLRQGGDFMHARVLLTPLFTILLPVMIIPIRLPQRNRSARRGMLLGVVGILVWITIVGWALNTSTYSGLPHGTVIGRSGIVDERRFYAINSDHAHPLTADDYRDYPRVRALQATMAAHPRGGLYLATGDYDKWTYIPYPGNRSGPQVVYFLNLGMISMNMPLDVRVIDQVGLAFPLAAHTERIEDGRIGHDKFLFPDWVIAETGVTTKRPQLPAYFDENWVNQARTALQCPQTKNFIASYTAPLTWQRFVINFKSAFSNYGYRIDRVPKYADELCHLRLPPKVRN